MRWRGLPASPWLASAGREAWPQLRVSQRRSTSTLPPEHVTATEAHVHLADPYRGYSLQVEIDRGVGVIVGPEPVALDELVHPFVTYLAIVAGRLLGREALHGGALVRDDGAWALLGPPGAGKSTTLAALQTAGATVMADDLVLLDQGDRVLSGPRCIDHATRAPGALSCGFGERCAGE